RAALPASPTRPLAPSVPTRVAQVRGASAPTTLRCADWTRKRRPTRTRWSLTLCPPACKYATSPEPPSLPFYASRTGRRVRQYVALHSLRVVSNVVPDLRAVDARVRKSARPRRDDPRAGRGPSRGHARSARARAELPCVRRLLGGLSSWRAHGSSAGGRAVGA